MYKLLDSASKRATSRSVGEKIGHLMFRKSEAIKKHQKNRLSNYADVQDFDFEDEEEEEEERKGGNVSIKNITQEDIEAYEENEQRNYFVDREEVQENEAKISEMVEKLQRAMQISGQAKDYKLDQILDAKDLNLKLAFYSSKNLSITDEQLKDQLEAQQGEYSVTTASTNYMNFLRTCMIYERTAVFQSYWEEGFIGRVLLYLIDKLIQASFTSFESLEQKLGGESQASGRTSVQPSSQHRLSVASGHPGRSSLASPGAAGAGNTGPSTQQLAVHDFERIEMQKRIKLLKSALSD